MEASRSDHGRSADLTTPATTTIEVTTADETTPPNPMPVPTPMPTPCPTSDNASGISAAGIAAIFGVVSSILLSCITVWQGFCYPRQEHKKRMKKQDVELRTVVAQRKTAEARLKSVEEELAHQREVARAALGEPLSSSDIIE
ncbi:hypothetical protein FRB94_007323 [Tulasnella sp. JGI-2019a]|nr:hypothetical protein FRB94_007323 [Tulasnella sp. JGI-2019a]